MIFTIKNLHASDALVPDCDSPLSLFRRFRLVASGSQILEDVDDLSRCVQLFSYLLPGTKRMTNIAESWGGASTQPAFDVMTPAAGIPAGQSRQVCVTLLSPFLAQTKLIPLGMLPLTLELECGEVDDCFDGTGNDWEITRPRLCASVVELDTALQNSYSAHLLSGKSLPFLSDGLFSMKAAVTSEGLFSFPISRGFTRLKTIYVSFGKAANGKWVKNFHHPRTAGANTSANDHMEWYMTLGSERFPVFPCESAQESYYRLRLCEQAHGSEGPSITPLQYYENHFMLGQNFELAPGSAHSGINTRSGSQLTMGFKNITGAETIHVVLKYENVINLSAAGTQVLD